MCVVGMCAWSDGHMMLTVKVLTTRSSQPCKFAFHEALNVHVDPSNYASRHSRTRDTVKLPHAAAVIINNTDQTTSLFISNWRFISRSHVFLAPKTIYAFADKTAVGSCSSSLKSWPIHDF